MKKALKKRCRKGFTLVETILAIFILFVVSTMLVNGFIAAMAYSYQTSIYSKSGSDNYSVCMSDISNWSNQKVEDREKNAYNNYIGSKSDSLEFKSHGAHSITLESLSVGYERHDDLVHTVPLHLNFEDGRFAPANDTNQRSDNRRSFFYYPEYCSKGTEEVGNIVVMYDKNKQAYYWVVKSTDLSNDANKVTTTPIYSRTAVEDDE